jgi:MFS family permease
MTPIPSFNPDDLIALAQQMLTTMVIAFVIAIAISSAVSAQIARYARRKGRSFGSFYWIGALLGPLASGTIVATIAPMTHMKLRVACPKCDEHVSVNAARCGHCEQNLTPTSGVAAAIADEFRNTTKSILVWGLSSIGLGIILLIFFAQSLKDNPNLGSLTFGILFLSVGVAAVSAVPARTSTADEIQRAEVMN